MQRYPAEPPGSDGEDEVNTDPAPIVPLLYPDVQTPDSGISLRGGMYNTPLGLIVGCCGIWGGLWGETAVSSCVCTSFMLHQSSQKSPTLKPPQRDTGKAAAKAVCGCRSCVVGVLCA